MKRLWVKLMLALTLAVTGCATTGGQCEVGALKSGGQEALAAVAEVALNPTSWASDLIELAGKLGADQVHCAVVALAAWLDKTSAPSMAAGDAHTLLTGVQSDARAHAKEVLGAYLKLRPTASRCIWPGVL